MNTPSTETLVTRAVALDWTGLSAERLDTLIKSGDVRTRRIKGIVRVVLEDIDAAVGGEHHEK